MQLSFHMFLGLGSTHTGMYLFRWNWLFWLLEWLEGEFLALLYCLKACKPFVGNCLRHVFTPCIMFFGITIVDRLQNQAQRFLNCNVQLFCASAYSILLCLCQTFQAKTTIVYFWCNSICTFVPLYFLPHFLHCFISLLLKYQNKKLSVQVHLSCQKL